MNLILITKKASGPSSMHISQPRVVLLLIVIFLLIPALAMVAGFQVGKVQTRNHLLPSDWEEVMTRSRDEVAQATQKAHEDMSALAVKLAQLQAQAVRLNALGQRLVEVADLDSEEFDFSQPPAQGGPQNDSILAQPIDAADFVHSLDDLAAELNDREQKMRVLESYFMNQNLQQTTVPAGRPIKRGWISSFFGMRTDPFNGRREYHKGVDLAGKEGSDIISVAAGIVTWSGPRYGYGNMVEINHGNGYITRYGHCKEVLVKAGDSVTKGQVIAHMGSTGRSTGPHVHFEVHKNGRVVNPLNYLRAAR